MQFYNIADVSSIYFQFQKNPCCQFMLHAWMRKATLLNMLSRRNVKMAIEKNLHSQFWHCRTIMVKRLPMWFYFWWRFCCCFWFFAVSSKNGHLHTQQWTGLRVLWTALSKAVFVPCYQQHKLIYYRDMLRSILPCGKETTWLGSSESTSSDLWF